MPLALVIALLTLANPSFAAEPAGAVRGIPTLANLNMSSFEKSSARRRVTTLFSNFQTGGKPLLMVFVDNQSSDQGGHSECLYSSALEEYEGAIRAIASRLGLQIQWLKRAGPNSEDHQSFIPIAKLAGFSTGSSADPSHAFFIQFPEDEAGNALAPLGVNGIGNLTGNEKSKVLEQILYVFQGYLNNHPNPPPNVAEEMLRIESCLTTYSRNDRPNSVDYAANGVSASVSPGVNACGDITQLSVVTSINVAGDVARSEFDIRSDQYGNGSLDGSHPGVNASQVSLSTDGSIPFSIQMVQEGQQGGGGSNSLEGAVAVPNGTGFETKDGFGVILRKGPPEQTPPSPKPTEGFADF